MSNGTILCSIDAASLRSIKRSITPRSSCAQSFAGSVRCQTNTIRIVLCSSSGNSRKALRRHGLLDATMVVKDHDDVLVPRGHHPCGAPYGFEMYYLHVMAGPLRK